MCVPWWQSSSSIAMPFALADSWRTSSAPKCRGPGDGARISCYVDLSSWHIRWADEELSVPSRACWKPKVSLLSCLRLSGRRLPKQLWVVDCWTRLFPVRSWLTPRRPVWAACWTGRLPCHWLKSVRGRVVPWLNFYFVRLKDRTGKEVTYSLLSL